MANGLEGKSSGMKRRVRRLAVAGSLVAVTLGVGVAPASALIQRSEGCVEWNSSQGCVVTQSCSVDSDTRRWSCLTWDTRSHTLVGTGGSY